MKRGIKIGLVGSSGGHLLQLLQTRPAWNECDRFWVTFETPDATSALRRERAYWCYYPTNRHPLNLLRNTLLALRVLLRERPTHLVSTGAAVAVPFFYVGRLFGARTIFIEVFDRVDSATLTGRLLHPIATDFLVQWPEQLRFYPKARLLGPLL
jgi:beta-1,4-N-acetylglucosaminyltransferase